MPIRKSSTAAGRRVGRLAALKLFTDRDHEREILRNFFERLAHPGSRPQKTILSIWGVGGIGKTSLLKKAVEELGRDLASLRLISLDLDHDHWTPSSAVAEFFWQMRSRLREAKPRGDQLARALKRRFLIISTLLIGERSIPGSVLT
jgi:ATPase subunit of ABC transporter with duplicated ATPase domains